MTVKFAPMEYTLEGEEIYTILSALEEVMMYKQRNIPQLHRGNVINVVPMEKEQAMFDKYARLHYKITKEAFAPKEMVDERG